MKVRFVKSDKARKSTSVVYNAKGNARFSLRAAKTGFGDIPAELDVEIPEGVAGTFATAKAKLTAEERKAARANAPKLTPAQKLAKLQERAAALQAKIDKETADKAAAAAASPA